jgi:SAM-dependent methyltransferase
LNLLEFRDAIFFRYLCHAPLALAMERTAKSGIYRRYPIIPRVLDLGCGEGLFAEMLFKGLLDTGVDPDPKEIEYARRRGRHRELIQTTGDLIPKPDNHFRTILSNSVLEHIPDLPPVLREVRRVLHPEGHFYFSAPSNYFDSYSLGHSFLKALGMLRAAVEYRKFFNTFWKHYHYYSLEGWVDLLVDCGFEVQEALTFNPRPSCILNDALAALGLPGLFCKRFYGRWVLSPQLRSVLMKPIARALTHRIQASGPCPKGGLVFMAVKKAN